MLPLLPRLTRFARALAGSQSDAEDLVQDACVRALQAQHRFEPGTRMDSWMFRIVRNLYLNQIRAGRVRGEHLAIVDPDELAHGTAQAAVESRLVLDDTLAALGRLPEEQRAVLLLVVVEGLSYADTAAVMELPIGTVTSRLGRARLALRQMTAPPAGDG